MEFKLNLKQELKLILSQEMQISIDILQMSSLELKRYIENENKTNPAIEVIYKNNYNNYIKGNDSEEKNPLDFISNEPSLYDFLEEQLGYLSLDRRTKEICYFIINNLDSKGYLSLPKNQLLKKFHLSQLETTNIFNIIYSLDPKGIGAENLQECLKIQLKNKKVDDKLIFELIDYYLPDLALQKFENIAAKLGISIKEIKDYLKEIQKLNPIPARGFYTGNMECSIVPDATIYIEDNKLLFSINDDLMPKVYINTSFTADTPQGKKYLERVSYIAKSIQKRYETLEKILSFLIKYQETFFIKGKMFLNTLTMKELASSLNVHESTISRAVNEKYLKTPQGIIPMKMLFLLDANVNKIKDELQKIIEEEDRNNPFSDESISHILKNKGFKIARRTVAKYREEIGYPSSKHRKNNSN